MARSLDILGTTGASSDRAILVRVKDPVGVAKAQGGAIGTLAAAALPGLVAERVYGEMANQFASELKDHGVDADVSVVDALAFAGRPAPASSGEARALGIGVAVGGALAGLGMVAWKFIKNRRA